MEETMEIPPHCAHQTLHEYCEVAREDIMKVC